LEIKTHFLLTKVLAEEFLFLAHCPNTKKKSWVLKLPVMTDFPALQQQQQKQKDPECICLILV
jgi:hypothetical protein